jgi:hypothetical protein
VVASNVVADIPCEELHTSQLPVGLGCAGGDVETLATDDERLPGDDDILDVVEAMAEKDRDAYGP